MKFKDKYKQETEWQYKVIIMNLYHMHKLSQDKNWKISDTAKYFGVSKGLVSENINLAKELSKLEECKSRKVALAKLKKIKGDK